MTDRTVLFKEVTNDLNTAWREVVRFYQIGDTRAGYLQAFELALSLCLPDRMLWQFEEYQELPQLPENPRTKVSYSYFKNCLLTYEVIMRKVGLIDKDPVESGPAIPKVALLDMGGD